MAMHCTYCERALIDPKKDKSGRRANLSATKDHVVPSSKGGRRTVWACWKCNSLKGDLFPEQWQLVMQHHPRWWKKFHSPAEVRVVAAMIVGTNRFRRSVRLRLRKCPFVVASPPLCRGMAA